MHFTQLVCCRPPVNCGDCPVWLRLCSPCRRWISQAWWICSLSETPSRRNTRPMETGGTWLPGNSRNSRSSMVSEFRTCSFSRAPAGWIAFESHSAHECKASGLFSYFHRPPLRGWEQEKICVHWTLQRQRQRIWRVKQKSLLHASHFQGLTA